MSVCKLRFPARKQKNPGPIRLIQDVPCLPLESVVRPCSRKGRGRTVQAGLLTSGSSSFRAFPSLVGTVANLRNLSPGTAAGPFRHATGFPFHPLIRTPEHIAAPSYLPLPVKSSRDWGPAGKTSGGRIQIKERGVVSTRGGNRVCTSGAVHCGWPETVATLIWLSPRAISSKLFPFRRSR